MSPSVSVTLGFEIVNIVQYPSIRIQLTMVTGP